MAAEAPRKPNALINEKSPYLLQHAYNPVQWFPWGEQALQKARDEDKPIFLSIGYSTCHWCHVMERESFEDDSIAALLNERFVPIKVDREERPDLDDIYMKAVMAMIGQGGWPLSVFLTPGLKPFYGGTYFPPSQRQGMPGFPQVLNFVSDLWREKREEVLKNSEELAKLVQQNYDDMTARSTLPRSILDGAYAELVTNLDEQYGGFSTAPKFPLPNYLEFLLRYYARNRKEPALRAVKKTLQSMASGGIHDHVGGGFHRYSTDRYWLVPHFEKMLYDNAQLAKVYLEAYQVTGEGDLLDTAVDTLEWVLREMTDPGGGFYSAQDADTVDGEGYYYTWTPAEIEEILGKEAGHVFEDCFGVGPEGNFEEGRSILHVSSSVERAAARFNLDASAVRESLEGSRSKLLAARARRNRPSVDDKVLSSWNGLAISALAYAYQVTGEARYLDAAARAAQFILRHLVREDGRISRRYRGGDVAIEGTLEDYAFVAASFLDLYEASFETTWFRQALRLADKMVELFWDGEHGGFFMNSPESSAQQALPRVKEGYDGPTPSGNSVAAMTLLRLSELTGRQDMREKAEATMKIFGNSMEASPFSHTYLLCALDFWFGSKELVLVAPAAGSLADEAVQQFLREIRRRFLPNKVIVALLSGRGDSSAGAQDTEEEFSSPLTEGKVSLDGKPTVYICENFSCKSPATDLESLQKQLGP